MADVSYRVWFGCRINGVEYERGEIVTLDDTDPEVLEALNFPAAPKIRHLLAIRWDQGAGTCSSANNGVVTASVSNGNRAASNPAVPINLGDCRDAGGPWYPFSGRIAYAAYYGSALSDARLLAHAQAAGLA